MAALDGIRVLDFSQAMAGPTCSMLLGDFGADVIKIEQPDGGDTSRRWGRNRFGEDKASALYLALNRNKSSVVLDLKTPEGKAAIRELMATADVILENFRPGVANRIGVGYEQALEVRPDIIYCSISGFGQTGPLALYPGLDMQLQAYAGHMSITGEEGRLSVRTGPSPIDLLTGAHAAYGIVMALRDRDRTGQGQCLDLSLYDTAIHLVSHYIADCSGSGEIPGKNGAHFAFLSPYGMFDARDREFYLGVGTRFTDFCRAINREDLAKNPLFLTNGDRLRNREALHAELTPLFKTRDAQYWVDLCIEMNIPASIVNNMKELIDQPQAQAREMIVETGIEGVKSAGIPLKLNRTPGQIRRAPPSLGADTDRILGTLKSGKAALKQAAAAGKPGERVRRA